MAQDNGEAIMKKLHLAVCGILALNCIGLAKVALAATTYDTAQVVSTTPIYHTVEITTPRRECREEEVTRQERRRDRSDSATPEILGAVIGGALGNAVGHSTTNSKVGTVVGAVLGGTIAHDIDNANHEHDTVTTQTVERCRNVASTHQEDKLVGYDVRYRYNGNEQTVRMDHDPGDTVKIRVTAEPVQ